MIKRKDILQVQYTKEWSMHHLSVYGSEKTMFGKKLGIALELFEIPIDVPLERCAHCKTCIKVIKKLSIA